MEIKSLHTHVDIVSRSKGASVIAKAAYNARDKLRDEYYVKIHDYSKKDDLVFSKIFLPEHIPKEFSSREYLWNSVEKIEKSKNSQLARNLLFTLPRELNEEDRINLISEFIEENFTSKGMIADCNIHNPMASDNEEQPHAHILLTLREIDEKGNWKPKSRKEYILDENGEKIKLKSGNYKSRKVNLNDWNEPDKAKEWRENFSKKANEYLAKNNIYKRIDPRTFEEQGREELPQVHLGTKSFQMEKKGIQTERGNHNRKIIALNTEVKKLKEEIAEIGSWILTLVDMVKGFLKGFSKEKQKEYNEFEGISFISWGFSSDEYANRRDDVEAYNIGLNNAKVKLEVMIEKQNYFEEKEEAKKIDKDNGTINKIFISHSSLDKEYTDLLVDLLHKIGIDKNSDKIIYTSKAGYGIPLQENIYDYLKNELNKNILVILVLSNNYYSSVACLNEMGATWVNSKSYCTIMLPFFEFKEIKGAIDPMEISFKINDKYRIDDFKDKIVKIFKLKELNNTIWQQDRDDFLNEIEKLIDKDKSKHSLHKEEIKSVRKGRDCDIEVDVMISNLGNNNVLCQEMIFNLLDSNNNKVKICLDDQQIDMLLMYPDEKRKFTLKLNSQDANFNPRRVIEGNIESSWATI